MYCTRFDLEIARGESFKNAGLNFNIAYSNAEELTWQYQGLLKEKLLLKREIGLTQALRDDTGPAVSGRRPVIVTFENFKWVFLSLNALRELICCCRDRDSVLRRAPVLKKSGLHVTEDLSKSVREVRANLTKYKKQQEERLILQKHPQVHANLEEAEPWFLLSPSIWQVIHWQQALCVGQRVGRGEDVWWVRCQ